MHYVNTAIEFWENILGEFPYRKWKVFYYLIIIFYCRAIKMKFC